MRARRGLAEVALHIAGIVGAEDCLLAGAMAVAAHGYARATKDVDLIIRIPLAEARRRLRKARVPAELRPGDPLEGDFPCIKGRWGGVPYDLLPPLVPIEWERSPEVQLRGKETLRVVELRALLALKLRAQGPQDLLDVAMLILVNEGERAHALALAEAYRVRDRLSGLLTNPRVLQSHAELHRPRVSSRPGRRRTRGR